MITDRESFLKGFIAGSEIVYSPKSRYDYMSHGFRARIGGSQGFRQYAAAFGGANPEKAQKLLQSLGINDKVLICETSSKGYCGGFYFAQNGRFTACAAKARFIWSDEREFGIRSLKDLVIYKTSPQTLRTKGAIMIYDYPIYYSKYYAELYGSKSEYAAAFDWNRIWAYDSAGEFTYENVPVVRRSGVGSGFGNSLMGSWTQYLNDGFGSYDLGGAKTGGVVFLA